MQTSQEIQQYSQAFAKRTTEYYFIDHTHITGKEILNFCDIIQVNLFIIKELYFEWEKEINRLKSPYFDYENIEVKKNITNLLNSLSNHILIKKEVFFDLVVRATAESLKLLIYPEQYFADFLTKLNKENIKKEDLLPFSKYWSFYKLKFQKLLLEMEDKSFSSFDLNWIWKDLMTKKIEEIENEIGIFDSIYTTNWQKIIPQKEKNNVLETESFLYKSENINLPKVNFGGDEILDIPNSLNVQFADNTELKSSLHNQFQQSKIQNLRQAIALNEKFLYINQLFDGNSLAFNDALDKLENCQNLKEALLLIEQKYAKNYQWNKEKEETKQFLDVIERRFL
ncbi:MAG: hypothetical protein EAZ85_00540 [Bacteroidetes bacterium]|nr:MAG: hypothetical protein EAZ85_00540 [Bacteroidota bacterium]TAG89354.1 MAG: hypothetical protein EAZ20_06680 [Bacteroidota bacterium]